ncbi:hypothetical protein GGR09_000202 [Bartonella heixiaziensis]
MLQGVCSSLISEGFFVKNNEQMDLKQTWQEMMIKWLRSQLYT